MKKNLFIFLICMFMLFGLTACGKKRNLGGDEILKDHQEMVMSISAGNKSCVPVELSIYKDGTYELFTAYKACRPGEACINMLEYSKSIKGKTDFDVLEIVKEDGIEVDKAHAMDNLPEYEIYMGNSYVEQGYGYYYTVEKGTTNKALEKLLNELNVDLSICAEPEYFD